jgi:hypothetical protein
MHLHKNQLLLQKNIKIFTRPTQIIIKKIIKNHQNILVRNQQSQKNRDHKNLRDLIIILTI